jgi:hypothetical protein
VTERTVVEHYVLGRRVYTLAEASDQLRTAETTLRQRVKRNRITAAGWINPRLPVYYATDLGIET